MKNTSKGKVSPNAGGCWFCFHKDNDLVFEPEWDTFVHIDCVIEVLKKDPDHSEAGLMTDFFSSKHGGWISLKEYERNANKAGD